MKQTRVTKQIRKTSERQPEDHRTPSGQTLPY